MGPAFAVSVEVVERIPDEPSGKRFDHQVPPTARGAPTPPGSGPDVGARLGRR